MAEQTTAQVIAAAIRESLKRGGHCYVSHMNGTNQARRIYDCKVTYGPRDSRLLKLHVWGGPVGRYPGPDRMEWYVVAVRDRITTDKLTANEHTTIVGAL